MTASRASANSMFPGRAHRAGQQPRQNGLGRLQRVAAGFQAVAHQGAAVERLQLGGVLLGSAPGQFGGARDVAAGGDALVVHPHLQGGLTGRGHADGLMGVLGLGRDHDVDLLVHVGQRPHIFFRTDLVALLEKNRVAGGAGLSHRHHDGAAFRKGHIVKDIVGQHFRIRHFHAAGHPLDLLQPRVPPQLLVGERIANHRRFALPAAVELLPEGREVVPDLGPQQFALLSPYFRMTAVTIQHFFDHHILRLSVAARPDPLKLDSGSPPRAFATPNIT